MNDQIEMSDQDEIQGILERTTYFNEENNYTVARLREEGRGQLTTIVGYMAPMNPGETLRVQGQWVMDKKYGQQFRVESYQCVLPATAAGIEKYLSSGLIKGIGAVMAQRLVVKFGSDTLSVIDESPERLTEVEGIGTKRKGMITKAWEEQKDIRDVMIFLQGHGVSAAHAVRIYKRYGGDAIPILRQNPYRLAMDISGIGFKTADEIAQKLGIDPNSRIRAEAGVLHVLSELAEDDGHVFYPEESLIEECLKLQIDRALLEEAIACLVAENSIVAERTAPDSRVIYLKALHVAEVGVARTLGELAMTIRLLPPIDIPKAIQWVEKRVGLELSEGQRLAIESVAKNKTTVITGGPGTGKTTLIRSLLEIFERKGQMILLAAPTGRAAKKMSEATGRPARTIHRLLEYSPSKGGFLKGRDNPLDADMVVVDEASMIDVVLMYHLLRALPFHITLILVGDVDQLPSVGPGTVLRDLIESGEVATVRLTDIFRQAQESLIVVNAHRVNQGKHPRIDSKPDEPLADFYFIEKDEPDEIVETVKELHRERIPNRFGLHPVDDIQVLSPMRKGTVGVNNLNAELQAALNPQGRELFRGRRFRVNDKVMQIANNYDRDVFNGDVGTISDIDMEDQHVLVRFDDREIVYEFSELDELVLAYVVSVHKSQGSEYEAVIMPIVTQHYVLLQRNLLYTAITRARKLMVLVGTKKALSIAVRNDRVQQRYSALIQRLRGGQPHLT